jgi:DNA invertase Pin-like site-specific DNA recombinase
MPKAHSGLTPAAAYIRMSSSKQEASPAQQRQEIAKLAAKHGCRILQEFIDEAISGDDTARRKGFQEMHKAACNGGGFTTIFCWDQDRFGRFDSLEAGFWIWPLRRAGIKLITVAQGVINWDDFQGRLIYTVQQEGKHAYLRDLSRNVVRGQLAGAAQGLWQGGPPPYGYKLKDRRLVPDPKTAPIVRRIFAELAAGRTARDVADRLNRDGIPGPGGKPWRFSRITKLVKKRVYLGEFRYGDNPEGRYHWASAAGIQEGANTPKGRHYRAETSPVVIAKAHKPLVTVAEFERCQQQLTARTLIKSPYRPEGNPYLLAGLLKCGHCDSGMVGIKSNYSGHPEWTRRYYMCSGYQQAGRSVCNRHTVHEEPIVDALVRKLQAEYLAPAKQAQLRAELRKLVYPATVPAVQPERLRKQITALDQRIDQGAEKLLAAPAALVGILTAKLDTWRCERDDLQARLEAHKRPQEAAGADAEHLVDLAIAELQTLRERLQEDDRELLRGTLRELVSKVQLWFTYDASRKRNRSKPARGLIHLRPDLQCIKLVPGLEPPGTSLTLTIPLSAADLRKVG